MKKIAAIIAALAMLASVAACTQYHAQGAGVGAAVGGVGGALLDRRNPWRGGLLGAALGGIAGATVGDISYRASRDAAYSGRPVVYRTEDGRGSYIAEPVGADERTKCKKVRERVWEDDRLVRDSVKEVCEGEKYERRY